MDLSFEIIANDFEQSLRTNDSTNGKEETVLELIAHP